MLQFFSSLTDEQRTELARLGEEANCQVADIEAAFNAEFSTALDAGYPMGDMIHRINWDSMQSKISEAHTLKHLLSGATSNG